LNEPFVSELAHALRFFQGIAFSGLAKPELAWKAFDAISFGVLSEDDALNSLLSLMFSDKDAQRRKKHSLAEYYYKVAFIFI
jgi:hypothetical protein